MNQPNSNTNKADTTGAVCGGVVSQSEMEKDPWAYMMAYVMPDKQFDEYVKLKGAGQHKEASKLADRYARSMI